MTFGYISVTFGAWFKNSLTQHEKNWKLAAALLSGGSIIVSCERESIHVLQPCKVQSL